MAIFSFKSQSESLTRNVAIPLAAISSEMELLSKSGYQRVKTTTRYKKRTHFYHSGTHLLTHSRCSNNTGDDDNQGRLKLYEISKIQESFEDLKTGLEAFSRYVPREVVSKVLTSNQFTALGTLTYVFTYLLTHYYILCRCTS